MDDTCIVCNPDVPIFTCEPAVLNPARAKIPALKPTFFKSPLTIPNAKSLHSLTIGHVDEPAPILDAPFLDRPFAKFAD